MLVQLAHLTNVVAVVYVTFAALFGRLDTNVLVAQSEVMCKII